MRQMQTPVKNAVVLLRRRALPRDRPRRVASLFIAASVALPCLASCGSVDDSSEVDLDPISTSAEALITCTASNTPQGQIKSIWAQTTGANGVKTISAKDIDKTSLMHTLVFYPPEIQTTVCKGFIGSSTKTYKFPMSDYDAVLNALNAGKVVKLFGTLVSGGNAMEPVSKMIR